MVSTLADLYLHVTSHSAGSAAETASVRKESKFSALPSDYIFQTIAVVRWTHLLWICLLWFYWAKLVFGWLSYLEIHMRPCTNSSTSRLLYSTDLIMDSFCYTDKDPDLWPPVIFVFGFLFLIPWICTTWSIKTIMMMMICCALHTGWRWDSSRGRDGQRLPCRLLSLRSEWVYMWLIEYLPHCWSSWSLLVGWYAFSALTLLVGRQEEHPASKVEWWGIDVVYV